MFDTQSAFRMEADLVNEAGQIAAATCGFLDKLAAFDASMAWDPESKSTAHWMGWKLGYTLPLAREYVRVARRLQELPLLHDAFASGRLSFPQVAAIVKVATPEVEAELIELARFSTATMLARVVDAYRRRLALAALEAGEAAQVAYAGRRLTYFVDGDGWVNFSGRLCPEDGAVFVAALEAVVAEEKAAAARRAAAERSDAASGAEAGSGSEAGSGAEAGAGAGAGSGAGGPQGSEVYPGDALEPWAARRADALVVLCDAAVASGLVTRSAPERTQVVVHVDPEALSGSGPGEHCELEDGAGLPTETARRLACDATVVALVEDANGIPLSVGRRTRKVSSALRRALKARDGGCVFPGCGDTRFTHAHHIEHWANGGETSLLNLATLCSWHHRHLHEGGYRVEAGALGDFTFYRRDGSVVTSGVPGADSGGHSGDLGIALDPDDTLSRYDGSRLDLEWIFPDLFRNDSRLPKNWTPPGGEPPGADPPGSEPPAGEAGGEAGDGDDDEDDEEWLPVPAPPDPPDEPPPAWLTEEPPEDPGPPGPPEPHSGDAEPSA